MAKIFTITEGLENLGALKSGGQGSVYKARRSGEIVTAIKILPTPISSETDDDKNFMSFQNEVQKLKKVNETPNPNVVSIIASGITNSGNLPYIEMEFIEGPDLAELLKPPCDSVFTIKEAIKVADHLANALAHCHRADVKHGDIKSNNIKFNQHSGNYILLDFGLSVMSDEQRRTSIRHAGAIEFMAPEQSAGDMLFETDIYSFGIILFELLSGTVPFPLFNKGEIARNAVMVSHMEAPPPDIFPLRRKAMPAEWGNDKKEREMQVPPWVVEMIYKCLEKIPAKRFKNGTELQEFIHSAIVTEENKNTLGILPAEIELSPLEEAKLKKAIARLELQAVEKEHLINDLKYQVEVKDAELYQLNMERYSQPKRKGISKGLFLLLFTGAVGLVSFNVYESYIKPYRNGIVNKTPPETKKENDGADSSFIAKAKADKKLKGKSKKTMVPGSNEKTLPFNKPKFTGDPEFAGKLPAGNKYKVARTAFFYAQPDKSSRNNYYVAIGNAILTSLIEKNDFIYVEFISSAGRTTKGWLSKKDLDPADE